MFSTPIQIIVIPFVHIFDIMSLFAAELEEPEIGISGKRLKKNDQHFYSVRLELNHP